MSKLTALALAFLFNFTRGHGTYWRTSNHLHPVQGVYVQHSTDGSTGDLFVAATEDSGVKGQWLTDQSGFLAAHAAQHAALPISYLSSFTTAALPHDEIASATQKRAVVTGPAIKYAYALPFPGPSEGSAIPYHYAVPSVPATTGTPSESSTECSENPTSSLPVAYPQYPFYYYPQMMAAAFAKLNAVSSALKEAGSTDETVTPSTQTAQTAASLWPYAYPYPLQYIMVDPNALSQSLTTTTPASQTTTTESPEPASEETS